MFRPGKSLLFIIAIALVCGGSSAAKTKHVLCGTVIGRTSEGLQISVPQPIREGTVFAVKLLPSAPTIAEAKVVGCTKERPFIASAKVVSGDAEVSVPIGANAYADLNAVDTSKAPEPVNSGRRSDGARVSIQTGAFYPDAPALRNSLGEYWNAYRLNYSFLRVRNFETLISAEYAKGSGKVASDGGTIDRTLEIVPVTLLAKLRPIRIGDASLFLGGGGGMYFMRTKDQLGLASTTAREQHPGLELSAGLESRHGWIMEMRYRDIPETDIAGYSLAVGAKF